MEHNLVNDKYGYVENVSHENLYKNIDYRDTTVPLWSTLYKHKNDLELSKPCSQKDINLALCASIIQLGKNINEENNYLYEKINDIEKKLTKIENKLNSNP